MTLAQVQPLHPDAGVDVSMKDLIEAGVHFGHQTAKWNPKMKPYIHDSRNGVYIINLQKTAVRFREALEAIRRIASSGQKILFVGTKKQAQDIVKEEAVRAGQYYVTERWIGGTLTNFHTIKRSINVMKNLQKMAEDKNYGIRKKKEILDLEKKRGKLETNYLGIQGMHDVPGAIFIIDPNREYIAVNEAKTLNIPIIAVVDTNCDPDGIDYVIPGNDDSLRAVKLYTSKVADAVLSGSKLHQDHLKKMGGAQQDGARAEGAAAKKPRPSKGDKVVDVAIERKAKSNDEGGSGKGDAN
ncbi:MAG: 30S ribosomal protein S2 [Deltaproteobacteria bacterium]|nr:30S ribosomal protein S2 [Deltaproteobacteria bacterium]